MSYFGTHVQCVNERALADVRASHNEYLLDPGVFIVELIVILTNTLHELVDVPLMQRVHKLQALFLLVLLHKVIRT